MSVLNKKSGIASATIAALTLAAMPSAHAVVLEQKYQAGQSASYDVTIGGDINLNADAATPVPWAGIPLAIPMTANGQVAFDTLKVNTNGGATVSTRVPAAQINASAFGMSAVVTAKNGTGSFSLNGAPAKSFPLTCLVNPAYAINVSRLGRIEGVTAIPKKTAAQTGTLSSTRSPEIVKIGAPDGAAILQSWLDVMPDVWPNRDVQVGETWAINSRVPLAKAPNGVLELGTTNLKLIGAETVNGTVLQHILVSGTVKIDGEKAALLSSAMPQNASKGTVRIVSDVKTVSGDLWFDANAGRLARLSLKVVASSAMSGTTKPDANGKTRNWSSTQGFNGTLAMALNNVGFLPTNARQAATPKTVS